MKKPLVSILTPCYNTERFIKNYMLKLLKQTYKNIELVLVNDGSKDNTEKIIKSMIPTMKKHGFKVVYKYQDNKGVGGAINTALKIMTGDFFCWCDCDNYYDNTYVEKNVKVFVDNPDCNIVRCDGSFFYENDLKHPYRFFSDGDTNPFEKRLFLNAIVEKNFHFGCAMIRTSAFDKVCKSRDIYESRKGQNWQLLLPMFYYYDSYYIDEKLFNYVSTVGSITNNSNSKEKMLELQNEHERILFETIKRMHIRDEKYYLGIIKRKYIERRIWVANTYNDEEMLKQETLNLEKFDKFSNKMKYFVLFPKYKKVKE